MDNDQFENKKKKKNIHKKWMWVFIVLSVLFAGSTGYLYFQFAELKKSYASAEKADEEADKEKQNLIRFLNNIENKYAELIYEYEGLDSILTVEKQRVKNLKTEIKELKGTSAEYKAKVEELKNRLEDYQDKINVLVMENEELNTENLKVKSELNNVISEKKTLEKKVEKGAALKAYEILAYGVRVKSSGEELPTQNARLTDKIKTCFILSENTLAQKGYKSIYVRIFDPDGKILKVNNDFFSFEGKNISYSMKKKIFYDNAAMDLCLYWQKETDYIEGDYTVVLFADSQIIGSTYFTLE